MLITLWACANMCNFCSKPVLLFHILYNVSNSWFSRFITTHSSTCTKLCWPHLQIQHK